MFLAAHLGHLTPDIGIGIEKPNIVTPTMLLNKSNKLKSDM